ncbi:MAG: FKBP-type peptidyl-prolyl cis-trans isomerase [Candidatus Methanoperedens sp.]|nr:FKBP-type peptidyl-prolyl cis-trans isomerase [Candidatus Methanoperedens sp.]MCE8426078.1 FKBP-type peptidyl-prolyl cis-trans isomerase [Candidatus Methanoperedens sp.]MCE8428822.1 FKBP-type peptidyl-prolyl cis-trans isomerase [Candidatus Methanoperedens sp.]
MSIENGDFIRLSFSGKTDEGRVYDTTDEEIAKANGIYNEKGKYGGDVIIVGAGHVIKGLDEALIGKEAGDSGSVTVPPEKAFGQRNPELIETIPITQFKEKPQVGMPVEVDNRPGMVIRVIGRMAQVDFNRFLAGQTVTYDYVIKEKIEDREGKIQGLFGLYIGKELPIQINDDILTVELDQTMTFNQRWLMTKRQIANEIINNTDIKEVVYIEKYNKDILSPEKTS